MSTFVKRGVLAALMMVLVAACMYTDRTVVNAQELTPVTPVLTTEPVAPQLGSDKGEVVDPNAGRKDTTDILDEIGYAILSMFAWFTGLAGVVLNAAVYWTVVQMASFVDNMGAIVVAWKVLRDVGNIILIFGFIAIGLATILDIQSYGAKKMLINLIIVAVTVNFSLFAARAIIDVGNVFAYQFYSQMTQTAGGAPAEDLFNPTDQGVSNAIMGMVDLQTFYSTDQSVVRGLSFVEFIFGALLFIIAAFVLFALAFMLIARFVILVFLMILSPMGFIGLIVPSMEGMAKKWWSTLISQSAVAPVLLLMVLISVTLMTTGQGDGIFGNTGGGSYAKGFTPGASESDWEGTASMILGYLISMGLLMASLIIAKQAGAFGANFAISTSRRITGIALSPISAPSRAIGNALARNTASGALRAAGAAYNNNIVGGTVRKIPLFGKDLDAVIGSKIENRNKFKIGGASIEDNQKAVAHRKHELDMQKRESDLKKAVDDTARGRILQSMSSKDVAKVLDNVDANTKAAIARSMSVDTYAAIMKDDKVDEGIKHSLAHDRYTGLIESSRSGSKREVQRWSSKDLAEFAKADPVEFERLANTVDLLSNDQREFLEKSEALTNQQRQLIKETGEVGSLKKAIADLDEERSRAAPNQQTISALQTQIRMGAVAITSAKQKAKLSGSELMHDEVVGSIMPVDLQAVLEEKKFSAPQIDKFTNHLIALPANDPRRQAFRNYFDKNSFSAAIAPKSAQI